MTEDTPIEIWFPVLPGTDGYPSSQPWEQLYAWPIGDGAYRIDNIPFFTKSIAVGDVVSIRVTENGWYQFDVVMSRSGRSVFRIWLSEGKSTSALDIVERLRELGCSTETTLDRLIAIDVPPESEPAVWSLLEAGKLRGEWDVQVGYSAE